jgi:transcriptional regulator with XRE-family HTH domain
MTIPAHELSERDFYAMFAHKLIVIRERNGWTEEQAAKLYGVTLRTYRKYEKGSRHGNHETKRMMWYAARCGVSAEWLLTGPYLN